MQAEPLRASESVRDAVVLPAGTVLAVCLAGLVRQARRRHAVLYLLLPSGDVPAVPRGERVEEAELAVPQAVPDVVPARERADDHHRLVRAGRLPVL